MDLDDSYFIYLKLGGVAEKSPYESIFILTPLFSSSLVKLLLYILLNRIGNQLFERSAIAIGSLYLANIIG
jgi:hypothetical protein